MRGGLQIQPSGCTSGFIATHNATGDRGVITADHCVNKDDRIAHNGVDLGRVTHTSNTTVDVAFIKFVEPFRTGARKIIYRSGAEPQWGIDRAATSTNYTIGQTQCHVGAGSFSEQCGGVTQNNVTYYSQDAVRHEGNYQFSACVIKGDSGGPTYTLGRTAAGIVSGGRPVASCPDSNSYTYSSYIYLSNGSLDTTVLTS